MKAMLEEKEVLQQVHEILSDPEHWTQGTLARDIAGEPVQPGNPRACSYCLVGAICRAISTEQRRGRRIKPLLICSTRRLLSAAAWKEDGVSGRIKQAARQGNMMKFNDNTTYEHVMSVIERALRLAEAGER